MSASNVKSSKPVQGPWLAQSSWPVLGPRLALRSVDTNIYALLVSARMRDGP